MESAASLVERAAGHAPTFHSTNGGPPRERTDLTPLVVVLVAFAIGFAAARLLDWRTHAHPYD